MKLSKNTTTLIAIAICIAGVLAYALFFSKKQDATLSEVAAPTTQAEITFLNLSDEIQKVNFDSTLFTNPRFTSLVDISVMVIPETGGRKDPFGAL